MKKTRSKKSRDTVPSSCCIFVQNDENKNFGRPSFSQIVILGTFRKVYSLKNYVNVTVVSMSTIPKRSDIEANYLNKTKTF
jgi:hypothetical protein